MLNLLVSTFAITQQEVVNKLFPNLWIFIAHVIATIILLIVLRFLVYEPFKKIMRKRRTVIKELIDDAVNKQIQATQYETQAKLLLKDSKDNSQQIIDDAKIEAFNQRKTIIFQANQEAKLIEEQNKNDIAKEKIRAQESIKTEMVDIAFNLANKILEKEIDRKTNQDLIDDFIKEIE